MVAEKLPAGPASHPDVEVIHRLLNAFAHRDADTILGILDPDIVITQTEALPWGGEYRGHEGFGNYYRAIRSHITAHVTPWVVFAAGHQVVHVGRTTGMVNATGAGFDIDVMALFALRDGRVTRFDAFVDTPAMRAVLGLQERYR